MSEDRRVARDAAEPAKSGAAGAARWADYLDWLRETAIGEVLSLSETERRTTQVPSGWTPIEMLSHLLHMEQRWFVWGFLGEQVAEPWGDWNVEEPWTADSSDETRQAARWTVPAHVSAGELAERLRAIGDRTRSVLRDFPPDARGLPGGRFGDDPPTLEWICFHVLAEYARHAGHLDVSVELGVRPAD